MHPGVVARVFDDLKRDIHGDRSLGQFSIRAMFHACCQAAGLDDVCSVAFCGRGSTGVMFLVGFHSGLQIVASIPGAWRPGLFASQVATMAFARVHLSAPVPSVYAWRDDRDSPVNTPYMIMEHVDGTPLSSV